jgi:hypothetical protein
VAEGKQHAGSNDADDGRDASGRDASNDAGEPTGERPGSPLTAQYIAKYVETADVW